MKNKFTIELISILIVCFMFGVSDASASDGINTPTISLSESLVASGKVVTFTYGIPLNTLRAKMYMYCPSGVQMLDNDLDWCNKNIDYDNLPRTQKFIVKNTTSGSQNISPNFYIYKTDRPDYGVGQSANLTVGGKNDKIETQSDSIVATGVIQFGSKTPKKFVKVGEEKVIAELKIKPTKGNIVLANLSVTDTTGALNDSLNSFELYHRKKKVLTTNTVYNSGQVDFNFASNTILLKKGKSYSFLIKSDVQLSSVGKDVALKVAGIGSYGNVNFDGVGIISKSFRVK